MSLLHVTATALHTTPRYIAGALTFAWLLFLLRKRPRLRSQRKISLVPPSVSPSLACQLLRVRGLQRALLKQAVQIWRYSTPRWTSRQSSLLFRKKAPRPACSACLAPYRYKRLIDVRCRCQLFARFNSRRKNTGKISFSCVLDTLQQIAGPRKARACLFAPLMLLVPQESRAAFLPKGRCSSLPQFLCFGCLPLSCGWRASAAGRGQIR